MCSGSTGHLGGATFDDDGKKVGTQGVCVTGRSHYLILNLGVSGPVIKVPQTMQVEYVRVWEASLACPTPATQHRMHRHHRDYFIPDRRLGGCDEPEQVASMCGAAPVTRASGKSRTVGFCYTADKAARVAITSFADDSRHS